MLRLWRTYVCGVVHTRRADGRARTLREETNPSIQVAERMGRRMSQTLYFSIVFFSLCLFGAMLGRLDLWRDADDDEKVGLIMLLTVFGFFWPLGLPVVIIAKIIQISEKSEK